MDVVNGGLSALLLERIQSAVLWVINPKARHMQVSRKALDRSRAIKMEYIYIYILIYVIHG